MLSYRIWLNSYLLESDNYCATLVSSKLANFCYHSVIKTYQSHQTSKKGLSEKHRKKDFPRNLGKSHKFNEFSITQ